MTLARYQLTIVDSLGNVMPGASVEVRAETTGAPLAVLYSDRAGTTLAGNPITADADGFAAFHVTGGAYKITATSGTLSREWRYVGIGRAQESDLAAVAFSGSATDIVSGTFDAARLPATGTFYTIGTITGGTVTLDSDNGVEQSLTANGAFTLAPPSVSAGDYAEISIFVTNGADVRQITKTGFTSVIGVHNITPGNTFRFDVYATNTKSILTITPIYDSLQVWADAIASMHYGRKNPKLLTLGDSTVAGFGADTAGSFTGAYAKCWPEMLRAQLNLSIRTSANNIMWFNDQNVDYNSSTLALYNPKVTLGAGWASANNFGFGGGFIANTTTTNALAYAPGAPFDTIEIYTADNPTFGSFTVDIGGSAVATISQAVTAGINKTTVYIPMGTYTVNIKRVSGTVFIVGVNTFVNSDKSIHIVNSGASAYRVEDLFTADYGTEPNLDVIAPDLTILCMTINDILTETNAATFSTDTQALITAAKVYGDVVLMTGVSISTALKSQAIQDTYTDVYRALAASNDIPLIDMQVFWGIYVTANAAGLMSDTAHPNAAGYGTGAGGYLGIAQIVAQMLAR